MAFILRSLALAHSTLKRRRGQGNDKYEERTQTPDNISHIHRFSVLNRGR